MIHPEEYKDFYSKLFAPVESEYGMLDADTIAAFIGFDASGPLVNRAVSLIKESK